MFSKGFNIFILLFSMFIIVGCGQTPSEQPNEQMDEADATNAEEVSHENGQQTLDNGIEQKILQLQRQFNSIEEHGWEVSPEGYIEIEEELRALEGIDDKRIADLRGNLINLKVGGTEIKSTGCSGKGTVLLTHPPMQIGMIETILPIGMMIGGHVTPIDHGYYTAKTWQPGDRRNDANAFVDVFAPAAGTVTLVQSMPSEFSSSDIGDYYIVLHYTCTFYSIFIHVNQLSPNLLAIKDTRKTAKVEAGEIIGRAPAFDFAVQNDDIRLPGFLVPMHYDIEPAKIHTVSMFDHFSEPIRSELLEKNVRQKEPRSGKIDYDIDGRLVGNWFEENTNGYGGKEEYQRSIGYWATHLSFAYDGIDPDLLIVSMGDYGGEAKQFAVKGNALDPKDVMVSTGQIKYELVPWQYLTSEGKEWDRIHFAKITSSKRSEDQVDGTVLVEMLEERKVKFESFPGKKASEVSGFTDKAKIYER